MRHIYSAVANVLRRKGLSSKLNLAGCVRCGACSALRHYERPCDPIVYHSARTEDERSQAFAIRHAVFVEEQRLFDGSDEDEHDRSAILLVAKKNDRIIGTVRIFPDDSQGNGHWVGGRLAVQRDFRVFRVGAGLVREAMRQVKKRGCTVFSAHIQEKNVRFFQKLGWAAVGPMEVYCGHPHQLMLADLSRVPADFDEDCLNDEPQVANLSSLNREVPREPRMQGPLKDIVARIRNYPGILRKQPIQQVVDLLSQTLRFGNQLPNYGDDAAVIPWGDEYLLVAADGMMTGLFWSTSRMRPVKPRSWSPSMTSIPWAAGPSEWSTCWPAETTRNGAESSRASKKGAASYKSPCWADTCIRIRLSTARL